MTGLSQILAVVTVALGEIGVLAVTYLNVNERKGEIGLRMALGTTRTASALQFLVEACALSVLGGDCGPVCSCGTPRVDASCRNRLVIGGRLPRTGDCPGRIGAGVPALQPHFHMARITSDAALTLVE